MVEFEKVDYPQFFVHPRLGTYYRFSGLSTFVSISLTQLQVRHDRPGQRYTEEGEWSPVSQEAFVDAYREYRESLLLLCELEGSAPPHYLNRAGVGEGWLYRFSDAYDPGCHLRLSAHTDEQGLNAKLLYSLDRRPGDPRRLPTTEEKFIRQVEVVFQAADAAVFRSWQEGAQANG